MRSVAALKGNAVTESSGLWILVGAFLKFSDGSNRKVADEQLQSPVGTGRMFGPFQQVPGKSISQVNFRIGANKVPQATGFSYPISVHGCH